MGLFSKPTLPTFVPRFITVENGNPFRVFVDTTTGVNYVLFREAGQLNSSAGWGAGGLTPLYGADSNLLVTAPDKLQELIGQYMNTPQ